MLKQKLDKFYDFMTDILRQYKEIIPVLKEEFAAIVADDAKALDAVMNSQQALLLSVRQFDDNMAIFTQDLGIPASNLTELIANLPEEEVPRFKKLQEDFRSTIEEVLFYRNKCGEILNTKLHRIETILDATGQQKENKTYDSKASEVQTSLFPKSFQTKI